MAYSLEKTMPEFWKKVGTKAFEITGAIGLTLFINVNSDISGVRSQITDLNRYRTQLVPVEDRSSRDKALDARHQAVRRVVEKNMALWRENTLGLERSAEQLAEDRERSLRSVEKSLGELRLQLADLESRPEPAPQPALKGRPTRPLRGVALPEGSVPTRP